MLREWSLVGFTLLTQMSVGAFVAAGVVYILAARSLGADEAARLALAPLVASVVLVTAGMLISFAHLGRPAGAPMALANARRSWLSRELLLVLLFGAAAALLAAFQCWRVGSGLVRTTVGAAGAVFGLGLVAAMSAVYRLPSQPAWNHAATPAAFFVTTFALGAVLVALMLVVRGAGGPAAGSVEIAPEVRQIGAVLMVAAAAFVGAEIVLVPVQAVTVAMRMPPPMLSPDVVDRMAWFYGVRLVLVAASAFLLLWAAYRLAWGAVGNTRALSIAAFTAVLASEFVGRVIFYASRLTVPF